MWKKKTALPYLEHLLRVLVKNTYSDLQINHFFIKPNPV